MIILVLAGVLSSPVLQAATTYAVNTPNDTHAADGSCAYDYPNYDCTLRDALALVTDGDTINFNIAGCDNVCTITLSASQGGLTWRKNVTLNGFSQTGAVEGTDASDSTFQVEIDGSNIAYADDIVRLSTTWGEFGGGTIKGLALFGCGGTDEGACINYQAEWTDSTNEITITKNIIGMNSAGTQGSPNAWGGVSLGNGVTVEGNIIGALGYTINPDGSFTETAEEDIRGTGILIEEGDSGNNTIEGNWIGICPGSPSACCYNKGNGVEMGSSVVDNLITGNEIGCNAAGVMLHSVGSNNRIIDNRIGTDATCTDELGNLMGILVLFGAQGGMLIQGNVIGRNSSSGLLAVDSDNVTADSNTICSNGTTPREEIYTMTASPLTYNGEDYDWWGPDDFIANIGAVYLSADGPTMMVLADNEGMIPQADGTNDFDVALCTLPTSGARLTLVLEGELTEAEAQTLADAAYFNPTAGEDCPFDRYCNSVFQAQGAGADYTVDLSGCADVAPLFQSPPEMIYQSRLYDGGFADLISGLFGGPVTGSGAGISLLRSSDADVRGNTITANGVGLLLSYTANTIVGREGDPNTVTGNLAAGIVCDGIPSANNRILPMTLADNCQDGLVENCQNLVIRRGCNNSTTLEMPAIKVATETLIEGPCCASAESPTEAASMCGNLSGSVTVMAADSGEMSTTVVCSDTCAEGIFSCSGTFSGSGTLVAYLVDNSGNTTSLSSAVSFGTTAPEEWTAEVAGGDDEGDGGGGDESGGDPSQITGGGGCSLAH